MPDSMASDEDVRVTSAGLADPVRETGFSKRDRVVLRLVLVLVGVPWLAFAVWIGLQLLFVVSMKPIVDQAASRLDQDPELTLLATAIEADPRLDVVGRDWGERTVTVRVEETGEEVTIDLDEPDREAWETLWPKGEPSSPPVTAAEGE